MGQGQGGSAPLQLPTKPFSCITLPKWRSIGGKAGSGLALSPKLFYSRDCPVLQQPTQGRGETLGTHSSSLTSATALQHLQSCFAHGDGLGEGHPHKRLLHRATLLLAEKRQSGCSQDHLQHHTIPMTRDTQVPDRPVFITIISAPHSAETNELLKKKRKKIIQSKKKWYYQGIQLLSCFF